MLWGKFDYFEYLTALEVLVRADDINAHLAAWVLARWHASHGRWHDVYALIEPVVQDELAMSVIGHQGPFLLCFSACLECFDVKKAEVLLAHSGWAETNDKLLARSMLLEAHDKAACLSLLFNKQGLSSVFCASNATQLTLDTLQSEKQQFFFQSLFQPLVTIIIPCYNSAHTLDVALKSILQQSWRRLEVIVVDDASTDHSVDIIRQWQSLDKRVKLIQQDTNRGAYAARNRALQVAKGEFITVHDADDWSHPEKIERQVKALLKNRTAVASISYWVRSSSALMFQRWRMEDGWIYRNVSSLLFRRNVIKVLGFWDLVSVNADTEYYYRVKKVFGEQSIVEVLSGVPLAFGRADENSLSQTSATHLRTQFRGVRKLYHDAATRWHNQNSPHLYLPPEPEVRPFVVPPQICRGSTSIQNQNRKLFVQQCSGVDENWYLSRYPDVAAAKMSALEHYLLHGETERRDPSSLFSCSGYAYALNLTTKQSPLVEAITAGYNFSAPIQYVGLQQLADKPVLMLFAHAASGGQFGAERSFIDVLQAFNRLGYRLIVALPEAKNSDYVSIVLQYCSRLLILPYQWWYAKRDANQRQTEYLKDFMLEQKVELVYVNTLVLFEPLLAARAADIRTVVHVRELPDHDEALCNVLGSDAVQIRQHLLAQTDYLIANSRIVADWLAVPERTTIISNTVSMDSVPALSPCPKLRVGMLSSNLAKKGLSDFMALANLCNQQHLPVHFFLYGPDSDDLSAYITRGAVPANVRLCGYVAKAEDALVKLDVVLNLSHFQESFGRTVLEAMYSGRVVIAYSWGALPELVQDGTGFLVPFKDWEAVKDVLNILLSDPELMQKTAEKAACYARDRFSAETLQNSLEILLDQTLKVSMP
ncbi:glycosyltransferase [Rheinheimera soli]|uniref:Glycosyltransferase involved in cell wall biosynthesis n=1 Tax=Rheinheimera soli TaxID=443616 RepID=A0ABU1VUR5_9GAMM|nr:glycosyltransferase [Rheinheimera soli]MDR7119320.1 glycosyltransferase involved in cell wall biosynthesis [Rheinheimera soli]